MNEVTLTIHFPDKATLKLFVAWMKLPDTYSDLYEMVAQETGMYTAFEKTPGSMECRVVITGRVVDDDDPDMFDEETEE